MKKVLFRLFSHVHGNALGGLCHAYAGISDYRTKLKFSIESADAHTTVDCITVQKKKYLQLCLFPLSGLDEKSLTLFKYLFTKNLFHPLFHNRLNYSSLF